MKKGKLKLINPEIRLEVTNICNANCIMCPREKMKRPQGILSMELYKRIVDEAAAAGATTVSLENYGEPFCDPFLEERTIYAKRKGLSTFTITNASLLDVTRAEKIVLAGLDKLRISMYGVTKDVYESIHKGLKFETVSENVLNLFKIRNKLGSRTPRVEMYFLLLEENKHQIDLFRKKWENTADYVSIWKPHNWSDGRAFRKLPHQDKKSCGRPFTGPLQVMWNGLVVPCCFDYDGRIILGDLNKQSLHEVMHDPRYDALREAHKKGEFDKYGFCNGCDQLYKREDVLVYTNIKGSRVGATNTTYFDLQKKPSVSRK
ncbi:MAG: radical SAM/SPASM domain-containing protein [Candidatus Omnitrophota bacterium]